MTDVEAGLFDGASVGAVFCTRLWAEELEGGWDVFLRRVLANGIRNVLQ